jgi:uncharacterized protein (TIGR00661 family)
MGLQKKKCLFLVQGEGRGHMTQSISMKQILEDAGMEVCEVIIGKSSLRKIPDFYYERIKTQVTTIESPNMSMDKNFKKVKPYATFIKNASTFPKYLKGLKIIHRKVKEHNPDFIMNFYEPLCGMYNMFYKPGIPAISIAHHYMFLHSDYAMPEKRFFFNSSLKILTWLTSFGSARRLALSFYPFENDTRKSIYVVPPLLRSDVLNHEVSKQNYLLIYLLNPGYINDIKAWHNKNPKTELHCFTDRKDIGDTVKYDNTLYFHQVNDKKFLDMMAAAKGVVTTAGFESVCEAMYMGKPVFMVPVEGHYEQYCNSVDAVRTNLAISDTKFDISSFLGYLENYSGDNTEFAEWTAQSRQAIMRQVYSVLNAGDNVKQLFPNKRIYAKAANN